jgi:hypothetical protein
MGLVSRVLGLTVADDVIVTKIFLEKLLDQLIPKMMNVLEKKLDDRLKESEARTVAVVEAAMALVEGADAKVAGLPHDAGVYERGKHYKRGALVTHSGSVFIARCDTKAEIGGAAPSAEWRLFCQRGRDAR